VLFDIVLTVAIEDKEMHLSIRLFSLLICEVLHKDLYCAFAA